MKIVIDARPVTGKPGYSAEPTFILRLYPETNEEMGEMEWGIACNMVPDEMIRVSNDGFHYAVCFKPAKRKI